MAKRIDSTNPPDVRPPSASELSKARLDAALLPFATSDPVQAAGRDGKLLALIQAARALCVIEDEAIAAAEKAEGRGEAEELRLRVAGDRKALWAHLVQMRAVTPDGILAKLSFATLFGDPPKKGENSADAIMVSAAFDAVRLMKSRTRNDLEQGEAA